MTELILKQIDATAYDEKCEMEATERKRIETENIIIENERRRESERIRDAHFKKIELKNQLERERDFHKQQIKINLEQTKINLELDKARIIKQKYIADYNESIKNKPPTITPKYVATDFAETLKLKYKSMPMEQLDYAIKHDENYTTTEYRIIIQEYNDRYYDKELKQTKLAWGKK
jgi:hypothetical protein